VSYGVVRSRTVSYGVVRSRKVSKDLVWCRTVSYLCRIGLVKFAGDLKFENLDREETVL